ncbi:MAG: malonyl-ACP O-methyltransferase BioC [Marinilabiliaceae bacterium]|nr:malonyl-ACP O-methyltransferase BioC [Marinilabiliaceae bacterium]
MKMPTNTFIKTDSKMCVDKSLVKRRFHCASKTYDVHATVQKEMAEALVQMAAWHMAPYQERMLELGCGTGLLTQEILKRFSAEKLLTNDLVEEMAGKVEPIVLASDVASHQFIGGDAEQLVFPEPQQVIWSGATIQWIEELKPFFAKLSDLLMDEGYVVLSSFGPDNYSEIKTITGKGIDYKTMQQVIESASDEFQLVASKEWHRQLWLESPMDVLKHMRYTGVNGVAASQWTKGDMAQFQEDYQQFAQLEGYPLTYHPFLLVLKKK